ncbi:MAG TPA: AMP-binding protein [Chloroflexota bacterium]|nr:AMP-binding protein [Chloroflexota bacterium]
MITQLYEIVCQRSAAIPTAVAIGGQQGLGWKTLTSRQLLDAVDRLAVELASLGIVEGDRVVLWVPNHWRTPVYLFAIWKLGAVAVPFDREMNPEAAPRILDAVEPRAIIVGYDERPVWAGERDATEWWEPGALRRKPAVSGQESEDDDVSRGGVESDSTSTPTHTLGGSGVAPSGAWTRPAEELAAIFFTSGTTGSPKGCTITHANLCSQVEVLGENIPLDPSCRLASILPLSHLFELTCGLLYALSAGAAIHYIPSRRGPDVVQVLVEQRITHMIAVPQLLTLMGQKLDAQLRAGLPAPVYAALNAVAGRCSLPTRHKLFWQVHRKLGGQLRMVATGGAAMPVETQLLWERLGVRIVPGYGTSECSPVVTCGVPDGSTPIGSVGRPLRGVEVRLGPDGELLVRGPNVMRGYWNDSSRTAEVLQAGWYATGDLATIDRSGNVRLIGRANDLIVLPSGLNVWPQDVEDVLRSDPAVDDAVVIAVPTAGGGVRLHAYLIPTTGAASGDLLGAIVARGNGRLAQHQRIATASWWSGADFPRTSTLKVRRNLLPVPESSTAVEVASALAADDPVGQAIAGVARTSAAQPAQTLGELGLDSLNLVELALRLEEKTGKAVADGDLRLDLTTDQVRQIVLDAPALDAASGAVGAGGEKVSAEQPLWPYTWGRVFRASRLPIELLYRYAVTRTTVLGREHLEGLPARVIFAGTHRSFADLPLVEHALAGTAARHFAGRLVVAAGAGRFGQAGAFAQFGVLAYGLYPLRQYGEREVSLRGLAKLASAGNAVLIFPQGRHTHPEQEQAGDPLARFRPGVAHLAAALEAVVVPFGVAGTDSVLPPSTEGFKGATIGGIPVSIHRGPLAIAFGAPLALDRGESPHAFAERLEQLCYALSHEAEKARIMSEQY